MYLNIQSLVANVIRLQIYVQSIKPDIILLSETHVTEEITDHEIHIDGYELIRVNSSSRHTGGCVIYIKSHIHYTVVSRVANIDKHNYILAIDVKHEWYNGLYASVYRSPNSSAVDFLDVFENWCNVFFVSSKANTICGDFNINMKTVNSVSQRLQQIIEFNGCKQIVQEYTHISERYNTLIDLVITNDFELYVKFLIDGNISDHETFGLFKDIPNYNNQDTKTVTSWKNYSKGNLIRNLAFNLDWNLLRNDDVNSMANLMDNALKQSIEQLTEVKQVKIDNNNVWYTKELKHLKSESVKCNIIAKNSRNTEDWTKFKSARNKYVNNLNKSKSDFFQNQIENNKFEPKKMWQTLKELLKQ